MKPGGIWAILQMSVDLEILAFPDREISAIFKEINDI
jgi:hypothetical protein